MHRHPSGRFEIRPRLDQERGHRGGDQQCDRDSRKNHLIALRAVVGGAGDERAEDRAPDIEEIHVAADRAEGFAVRKILSERHIQKFIRYSAS